jgi:phosphatidylglycerophosphate synthase
LVIDARPQGPRGLLAAEVVLGRSMLRHLLDLALELSDRQQPVRVHARAEDHRELRELIKDRYQTRVDFVRDAPGPEDAILRTDRFYDAARLRAVVRRGRSPETAVIWRLDQLGTLLAAEEELTHRLSYQPLGKYWAFPLAQRLAETLRPTAIRPNVVTLAAAALMLLAAGLVAGGASGWAGRAVIAAAMAMALVLDTTDGRLARLQGTSSTFGRWLDHCLDEVTDLALHAAIAWAAFVRAAAPVWLLLGIAYASGKYLFLVQSTWGDELERESGIRPSAPVGSTLRGSSTRGVPWIVAALRLIGHADLRWHFWIVLAILGRLDVALVVYAAYFPARALGGALRKGVRYA